MKAADSDRRLKYRQRQRIQLLKFIRIEITNIKTPSLELFVRRMVCTEKGSSYYQPVYANEDLKMMTYSYLIKERHVIFILCE